MRLEKKIPKVSNITFESFQANYVVPQIPVVIQDAVQNWPALNIWNAEYLEKKIGHVNVGMKKSISHKHPDLMQDDPGLTIQSTFSEYLKKTIFSSDAIDRVKYYVSGDENYFFKEGEYNQNIRSLMSDFTTPNYFKAEMLQQISFWISVKGLFSWLHFDGNCHHNVNVQVSGSKRVMLFDPDQIHQLYPITFRETPQGFNFSKVDASSPDYQLHPLFKEVGYQETVLEKGDMLFIPVTWYHAIQHTGDVNINVNFWWKPDYVKLNPTMMRAEMFKVFDKAYLRREVMKENAPRWLNWCKRDPQIAEFLFQCDEYLAALKDGY